MGALAVAATAVGICTCEDCEQMRAVSRPRRRVRPVDSVDRLAIAGRGGPSLAFVDTVGLFLFGSFIAGGGYALLYATMWLCVFLSPGASAADPVAVRQSQTASAEAAAGPTSQAVR